MSENEEVILLRDLDPSKKSWTLPELKAALVRRDLETALKEIRDHGDHDKYCDSCVARQAIAEAALDALK